MSSKVYLTTTLPYVNAEPHIGFAAELVHADVVARYHLLRGDEVCLNTGTDEHGLKVYRNAVAAGQAPQAYADSLAVKFKELESTLGLWEGIKFTRTTNPEHEAAAQEFWRRCARSGDIYKKQYKVKYCVGCELEKTESELVDGKCPIHPNLELEIIEEENYFFKFSKYQKPLLDLYAGQPDLVVPDFRFNEIRAFVERGLEDFSISRLKSKLPWGVPVPDDSEHVMYVWFDALVSYISTIGWPNNLEQFNLWWPVIQFAGKDNLRQQTAIWQAMLMSAGLQPSKQIIIRGFINSGGQKMSKSLGNVIAPGEVVKEFGVDALRFIVIRHVNQFEDTDLTMEKIKELYNADLANGLGNLTSRLVTMAKNYEVKIDVPEFQRADLAVVEKAFENYDINQVARIIWAEIGKLDGIIQETEPFKLIKTNPDQAKQILSELLRGLLSVAFRLQPLLPQTAEKIVSAIRNNDLPEPLFLRKE